MTGAHYNDFLIRLLSGDVCLRPRPHDDDLDVMARAPRAETVDLGCLHSSFCLPLTGA